MNHILAAAAAGHDGGWQHALGTIGHYILKFIVPIVIIGIVSVLIFMGGMKWLQGVIVLLLGALLTVAILPQKAVSFIGQVNHGSTVKTTGATIGELIALGALLALALFASKG